MACIAVTARFNAIAQHHSTVLHQAFASLRLLWP
nr:MAG TPA: hypothetical protein [Bacteriophage sp.]